MIGFNDLLKRQKQEVSSLRSLILSFNDSKIAANTSILGSLLTGSVARGDARTGPFGIDIDIAVVVDSRDDINLTDIFGKDVKPDSPFHCVPLQDKICAAISAIEIKDLRAVRTRDEPAIFALNESEILDDKKGLLRKWKEDVFVITPEQVRERALRQYFRFCYLTGEYRIEKWSHRGAWVQLAQNFNEANECYCSFLYCINGMFIPRKDWLAYLTYDMALKPQDHQEYLTKMYESRPDSAAIIQKSDAYERIKDWMETYIEEKDWHK